jgi:hypothetical protein
VQPAVAEPRVEAHPSTRWLLVVVVLITAALIGYFGVRAIADAVASGTSATAGISGTTAAPLALLLR